MLSLTTRSRTGSGNPSESRSPLLRLPAETGVVSKEVVGMAGMEASSVIGVRDGRNLTGGVADGGGVGTVSWIRPILDTCSNNPA